jgi:hypothetical protein
LPNLRIHPLVDHFGAFRSAGIAAAPDPRLDRAAGDSRIGITAAVAVFVSSPRSTLDLK